jgi:hypothetical protein
MNGTAIICSIILAAGALLGGLALSGAFHHTEPCHLIHQGTMQAQWVGNCRTP